MPYSITTRPLGNAEREMLGSSSRMSLDEWAWVVWPVPLLAFVAYWLGRLIEWLLSRSAIAGSLPSYMLAAAGGTLGLLLAVMMYRTFREYAAQARADLDTGLMHVIEVTTSKVVQQKEYNDEGPIYFFELDDEHILLLWGQWQFDPYVVFAGGKNGASAAPDPNLDFPSTEFTVHRAPILGCVLRLEVRGQPLTPVKTLECGAIPLGEFGNCEILRGKSDDVPSGIQGSAGLFNVPK